MKTFICTKCNTPLPDSERAKRRDGQTHNVCIPCYSLVKIEMYRNKKAKKDDNEKYRAF